ncbi:MAG: flagellar assembly factor FliW [bacterium]|nr:MAG: flagellar assembly factor FliW [bacterium]
MEILSGRLGKIDIDPARIITFTDGIIGFGKYKRYIFLPFMEDSPLELLQAVDHGNLAFITVDPFCFASDYRFDVEDHDLEEVQASTKEDVVVKVIVTIPEDPKEMCANMQGPLLINESRLLGKQIVLHDKSHDSKYAIFAQK